MRKNIAKKVVTFLFIGVLALNILPMNVYASTVDFDSIAQKRTTAEKEELRNIYQILFPNDYHYIENYEKNGASKVQSDKIDVIVNKYADYNGITYQLCVMSNGQIFMNSSELVSVSHNSTERGSVLGTTYTRRFNSGDHTGYITWEVTYVISPDIYDHIKSYDDVSVTNITSLMGFRKKMVEDVNSPAYVAYTNVRTSSGVLYDLGVAVGANQARAFWQIASGLDTWLWNFFEAFFSMDD